MRADEKLTAFVELESVIGSAINGELVLQAGGVAAFCFIQRYVSTNKPISRV